ncbi:hypothetical protein L6164_001431 [Bauhinia variegata]|uniref:Uncharacterized protein n=1 Tax=Bauhinia variegata TaxID=167791 RepID=A0ACB9QBP5_BAUVA|nr:hypothetical protein L6164_001431 [Bauhinia variegata]
MVIKSSRMKRKLEPEPALFIKRKLRSKLPRRRRCQISPVLLNSMKFRVHENRGFSVVAVDSSTCSYIGGEVSCNSSRASVDRLNSRKRLINEIEGFHKDEYAGCWGNRRSDKQIESEVEVSESSCVESNSGVGNGVWKQSNCILKFRRGRESKNVKETEGNEGSEACAKSDISRDQQQFSRENFKISSEITENDVGSVSSDAREKMFAEMIRGNENRALELEVSPVSRDHIESNSTDLNAQSTIKQPSKNLSVDCDLVCREQLSSEDVSEYYDSSQEASLSDLHSEIFPEISESELDFSDFTSSLFIDSGSQFSEGSVGESAPSHTYGLFLQYSEEFVKLTPLIDSGTALCYENEISHQPESVMFEDGDDEESYKMLRKRERRQMFLCNYDEKYFSTTKHGELVLQQRLLMVHWIVEQTCREELRQETMFLGVSLLDRVLSKGYFKNKRNLQIVGIACLTLATRIEENQPYNSVRQKNFYLENSVYSRCEVVAMEWVVQEVLNYQCYLPTIYNFLWFYLKAARADANMEKRVKYLAVLALSAPEQLCYWPSTVAATLVFLAYRKVNQNASHNMIKVIIFSQYRLRLCYLYFWFNLVMGGKTYMA